MKEAGDECEHARETNGQTRQIAKTFACFPSFSVQTGISGAPNNQIKLPCGGSCVTPDVE
jgi:hypothetical protein